MIMSILRWFLVFCLSVVLVLNTGCVSMQMADYSNPRDLAADIQPGDTIWIIRHDGTRLKLDLIEFGETGVSGRNEQGKHFEAYTDIREIRTRDFDPEAATGFAIFAAAVVIAATLFTGFAGVPNPSGSSQ